jgi:hypothetical protein
MKTNFITFGSHESYVDAVSRLVRQANNLNIFTEIKGYTLQTLQSDKHFFDKHGEFIINNKRGFGYWIWKPYLINKQIENMEDGDVLFYCDVGCELGIENKDKFLECIDLVKKEKLMYTRALNCLEITWCKKDLLDKLEMDDEKYLNTDQLQATTILLCVCPETRRLIKDWYEISCNYHNIDDSPSISKNYDSFIEHRHDQSVFSLLVKKYNLISENTLLEDVIYIFRNKGGISRIKEWISIYGTSAKKSMYTPF